ncbi:DUF1499 domain-containing protein [Fuscibacter oryzae]|uniref:DUF1499 domain-containing protein n=1 Tax=Fuscibacter oryzae TaxID=2803939 RepID=A0A8J7SS31_9RHOB|nr:DUF1499 domain-containing protein [Fuscibacter oryzae]MBL4928041.1 DUF1499 domain-containing protein [Fuscibacter oryzae]
MKLAVTALVLLAVVAAADLWVRLAPFDPAAWNVDPRQGMTSGQGGLSLPVGDARPKVDQLRNGATTQFLSPLSAQAVLARLDSIALATPRTTRLAGSAEEGRITWVTRSALWGFPDYTTAQARPGQGITKVTLWARQRFGRGDLGVNAARLTGWIDQLLRAP